MFLINKACIHCAFWMRKSGHPISGEAALHAADTGLTIQWLFFLAVSMKGILRTLILVVWNSNIAVFIIIVCEKTHLTLYLIDFIHFYT